MRARSLKPGFFKNEKLAALPFEARLLFIGLWCLADREGRLEDRPKRISAEVFPYERVNVDKLLDVITCHGFTLRYEVDGNRYIQIVNFSKHQFPHPHEAKSIIPPCNYIPCNVHLNPSSLNPSSLNPGKAAAPLEYPMPDPKANPKACLVLSFKTRKGVPFDDRAWDRLNFARCMVAAGTLLGLCKDLQSAESCLNDMSADYDAKGLSWTLETVARNAPEWLKKNGRIDANSSRAGLRLAIAQRKAKGGSGNGLEKISAREVLNPIRVGANPANGNSPQDQRAGGTGDAIHLERPLQENEHGSNVDTVRS